MLPFGGHVLATPYDDGYKDEEQDCCNDSNSSWVHVYLLLNEIRKSYKLISIVRFSNQLTLRIRLSKPRRAMLLYSMAMTVIPINILQATGLPSS